MTNEKDFSRLLFVTARVFNEDMTEERVAAYYWLLKDYPLKQLELAIKEVCKTKKFFPKPADIIELIEGNDKDAVVAALDRLEFLMDHHGYNAPYFDDPVFAQTVRAMGGWERLCDTPEYVWAKRRQEFARIYESLAKRDKIDRLLLTSDHRLLLGGGIVNEQ